jgi:ribosomal protein L11 methyltransferase
MRTFVVTVPADLVEVASDRLWTLGVRGIEERSTADGRVDLRTSVGEDDAAISRAARSLDPGWDWRVEQVDPQPATTWRMHARPVVISPQLAVVPAWADHDLSGLGLSPDAVVVPIEPGGSFGLGDHPTTRATLGEVAAQVSRRPGCAVLDVGCGSGVVAIAAARLGAGRVVAIDIADAAIEATRENAAMSRVSTMVDVSTTPLHEVTGTFDVVAANILAPELIALADDLRRVVAHGGVLVVSGVLAGRHDHVLDALAPLVPIASRVLDGWAAVSLVAPPT